MRQIFREDPRPLWGRVCAIRRTAVVAVGLACMACGELSRPSNADVQECVEQQFNGMVTCREVNHYTRSIEGETWHYFDLEVRPKESELTRKWTNELADSSFAKALEVSRADIEAAMTSEASLRMVKRGKRWYFEWIEG